MPVFSLCLKIFKKNIPMLIIYFGVFIMVSLIMANMTASSQQTGFSETKTNIVLIAGEQTPLVEGLREELSKIANFEDIEPETNSLQDALFFGKISYILRIPAGFTESFMNGDKPVLDTTSVPGSFYNVYVDMRIEQYLNIARLYVNHVPDKDLEILKTLIADDLSKNTMVDIKTAEDNSGNQNNMKYYFNYLPYSFLLVVILGISSVMLTFNNLDIKRRNACAPIEAGRMNLQFILANTLFTLVSWIILVLFCLLFSHKNIPAASTRYFIINSFAFALCASGISFLIGNLVKGREAITALANVVTIGSCFISGVFVPQVLLSESVLRIAGFLPTYWYVKANDRIAELTQFSWQNLTEVANYILIELGFAAAFFIIALVVGKRKRIAIEEA